MWRPKIKNPAVKTGLNFLPVINIVIVKLAAFLLLVSFPSLE